MEHYQHIDLIDKIKLTRIILNKISFISYFFRSEHGITTDVLLMAASRVIEFLQTRGNEK